MRLAVFALMFSALAFSQSTAIKPDCDIPFMFSTGSGSRSPLTGCAQNLQGVTFWHMTYQSVGYSGVSLTVQTAPDNSGTPGSWSTFTAATGSNPATSLTGVLADATFSGYTPWISVDASLTGTGTVTGHLYGCRTPGCGSGGSGGSSGCAGTVGTPCVTGAASSAGSAITDPLCDQSAPISVSSTSGLVQIAALSGSTKIHICHISVSLTAESSVEIETGTGTNCGTSTTALSGAYQNVLALALDFDDRTAPVGPAGYAVCLNFGSTTTAGGLITYAQY